MMNQHLGHTLTAVEREIQRTFDFFNDPITRMSGCVDEFAPGMHRRLVAKINDILTADGYTSFSAFVNEVEARTSARFVYFGTALTAVYDDNEPDLSYWK